MTFKLNYCSFFGNKSPHGNPDYAEKCGILKHDYDPPHIRRAQKLMNAFISEVLDPNMNYSRLSFLESGKEAIDIKDEIHRGKSVGHVKMKLPSISNAFY